MAQLELDGRFERLTQVAESAVGNGVVPGLTVAVGQGPKLRIFSFGTLTGVGFPLTGVDENSVYDLASLTKALCTSLLAMTAVAGGGLRLQDEVRRWLPRAPSGVTISQLLSHSSGWPAHVKFYETLLPVASGVAAPPQELRKQLLAMVAETPTKTNPGEETVYSDLGFIALGYVLECVFNTSLDEAFEQQIAAPLALPSLRFGTVPEQRGVVAPTEHCSWRNRLILGEVHDQNAWVMGGVAGHAGLFGTAKDVATLVQSLLRTYAGNPLPNDPVDPNVLRHFWAYKNMNQSTWALGWDRPSLSGSLAGNLIDRQALGHLAFTGCSIWVDPLTQTQVVMLSNRIHPAVKDDLRFRKLRPAVMDAVLGDMNYKAPV